MNLYYEKKQTRESCKSVKVYQDLNKRTIMVKVYVHVNNWSLQMSSQNETEIQLESSGLIKTSETS